MAASVLWWNGRLPLAIYSRGKNLNFCPAAADPQVAVALLPLNDFGVVFMKQLSGHWYQLELVSDADGCGSYA